MSNLEIIKNDFKEWGGTFVITPDWDVQRFIGIGEDEMDYYYIFWDGRKVKFFSCVMEFFPLKGKIDQKNYNEMCRIAALNHHDIINPSFEILTLSDLRNIKLLEPLNMTLK